MVSTRIMSERLKKMFRKGSWRGGLEHKRAGRRCKGRRGHEEQQCDDFNVSCLIKVKMHQFGEIMHWEWNNHAGMNAKTTGGNKMRKQQKTAEEKGWMKGVEKWWSIKLKSIEYISIRNPAS